MTARHALWWSGARRSWCARHGVADFPDVARAALELLENPVLAQVLGAGLAHITVDEFQDTNWKQWALLDRLRDAGAGHALIVGDEKQAIFRFRGGDIEVFDGVRRLLLGDESPRELSVSRRSRPELVEWVNATFAEILPPRARKQAFEAPFQALSSSREAGGGLGKLEPSRWAGEDGTLEGRELMARARALFLRELCADAALLRAGQSARHQPQLADISAQIARGEVAVAVLVRTHAVKAVCEAALRAEEVPFVSVKGRGFFQSEPVQITLHLLRYLLDGADERAWIGLARGAIGGLSDVALLERSLADGQVLPSRADDGLMMAQLQSRLQGWAELARVLPFSEVLERVLDESELSFQDAMAADAAQRAQNWRRILEIVREREASGEGGLSDLAEFLGTLQAEDETQAEAALPVEGSIALMTTYAAKGLEYPLTMLAQCDDAPPTEGAHLLRGELDGEAQWAFRLRGDEDEEARLPSTPPLLWEILNHADLERREAEWKRLFYVACTRAQDHLMLIAPPISPSNTRCWLALCAHTSGQLAPVTPSKLAAPLPARAALEVSDEPPQPLPIFEAREIGWETLVGARSSQIRPAQARTWLENSLRERGGDAAQIREETPWSAPASALGFAGESEIIGNWEWLARAPQGLILLATGDDPNAARARAQMMEIAADIANLGARETWALWMADEKIEAVRVS